jgi:hypothetical protein
MVAKWLRNWKLKRKMRKLGCRNFMNFIKSMMIQQKQKVLSGAICITGVKMD